MALILALPLAASGCRPNKKTANPEDYYPLIQVALEAGAVGAMIARNEAINEKNFAACVAADVLADAFKSAGDVLQARISDQIVIPSFDMDLAECLALRSTPTEGDEQAQFSGPVMLMMMGPIEDSETTVDEVAETTVEKGNPDAAVLVEAIAGVTLTAALYYANKLKTANCKKGVAALSAIHYVNGMIKPIADEIAEPDGKVSVPAVIVDFAECG
jgi:hypothetical protein